MMLNNMMCIEKAHRPSNSWANQFQPLSSPRLSSGNIEVNYKNIL